MTNTNKRRGNDFERRVAHYLTEHLGIRFKRTPYSGASPEWKGDVFAPDNSFPFTIEVKKRKSFKLEQMLVATEWIGWWIQALSQANQEGKHPLLIFAGDNSTVLFCIHIDLEFLEYRQSVPHFQFGDSDGRRLILTTLSSFCEVYRGKNKTSG